MQTFIFPQPVPQVPPISKQQQQIWQSQTTTDGKTFYFNTQTRQSQWNKPEELMTDLEKDLNSLDWKELKTKDGREKVYYHNKKTNETTWKVPDVWKNVLEKHRLIEEKRATMNTPLSAIPLFRPVVNPVFHVAKPVVEEFETKEEAEEAFKNLLSSVVFSSTATWEEVLPHIVTHPHYRSALKTLEERKRFFQNFQNARIAKEEEERKIKMQNNKAEFQKVMDRRKDITPDTRWKHIKVSFKHEPIMRILTESEAETLFEECLIDLRKKLRDEARAVRRQNVDKLNKLLHNFHQNNQINHMTSWREAKSLIKNSRQYLDDKKFQEFDMIDMLMQYEDFIKILQSRYNSKKFIERSEVKRLERINREEFISVLKRLQNDGLIYCRTKWKEIFSYIKEEESFRSMLGQPGSTPLDLFRDIVIEMEDLYLRDRSVMEEMIKERGFPIKVNTEFREFLDYFSDEQKSFLNKHSLELFYDEMMEEAVYFEKLEARKKEKKQKKKVEAFKHYLKKLEPPILIDSKWEDIRPRVANSEEYVALEEDTRALTFEKYLVRLAEKAERNRNMKSDEEAEEKRRRSTKKKRARRYSSEDEFGEVKEKRRRNQNDPEETGNGSKSRRDQRYKKTDSEEEGEVKNA
ncbi:hypothetical protein HDU92_007435 [Lobulomyces angularis]|nr:hypothetical protein HDU92_007435 [Lobulomyces angularis]